MVAELKCRRHTSVYGGFLKKFTFFAALHVALFALENMLHYFRFVLVSGRHHFLCLGVACGVQGIGFVGRCRFYGDSWNNFTHIFSLGAVDSDPEASRSPCSCGMEKCARSMLQLAVPFMRFSHLEI